MASTALILGITGGFGCEMARALRQHGWQVRAMHRKPKAAARALGDMGYIDWVKGDAMNAGDVREAAEGASLIVHAVNPPGYRNWAGTVVPMLDNTIAAARETGARILFPGTVYNFGPDAFPPIAEDAPQNPKTRKGKLRVEMEKRLEAASRAGVPVLILRAGDFFGGTRPGNNWFAQGLVTPGKTLRSISYPGPHRVGHQWAYLPDMAETAARLLMRCDEFRPFEVFHFGGHWLEQGIEMADAIRYASRNPDLKVKRLPWLALTLLSPFVETFREMREMRYLWQTPVCLDNTKLTNFLGREPHTPLDIAVTASLAGLDCLPDGTTRQTPVLA
ncbi:NAD-dependent epimerase/dehydratase family protein [Parvibaculum sp.]|uniref:NAD-dependent epimerase/dehydratase family protein n=1 Tax=Parvibaculum sp. TaxID=2024848 RepID=UPI00391D2A0C